MFGFSYYVFYDKQMDIIIDNNENNNIIDFILFQDKKFFARN
jgi:hypothetical protein